MRLQADYLTLMELLFQLIEFRSGGNIEPENEWLNDAQALSIKLYDHLTSILRLAQGGSIDTSSTLQTNYIDHASVQVVTRAALESYLVFFFIYGKNNKSLSQFRHKIWRLAGLMDRQKYGGLDERGRAIIAQESEVIQQLRFEITQSEHLKRFSIKQRRQLLEGRWQVGSKWKDLAEQAGFHGQYFENKYNYFCGYSHSSYASVLQVNAARSPEAQQILTNGSLGVGLILMAHFSHNYTRLFPKVNPVIVYNEEAINLAETYRFDREDMAKLVGG